MAKAPRLGDFNLFVRGGRSLSFFPTRDGSSAMIVNNDGRELSFSQEELRALQWMADQLSIRAEELRTQIERGRMGQQSLPLDNKGDQ